MDWRKDLPPRKNVTLSDLVNILTRNVRRINFSESKGRVWKGRPAFTDTSDMVQAEWSTLIGREGLDRPLIGRELYRTEIFS